ncbi:MAG: PorT family protein [Tannerella sp.]|nr:PorT family protein [Tannerella sp.]
MKRLLFIACICCLAIAGLEAQSEKPKNQPYADMKLYHLGFHIGFHAQDMILTNSGAVTSDGEVWYAEIPSYSPGFSVGVIGDLFLNPYMNLRFSPTVHFGDKTVVAVTKDYKTDLNLDQRIFTNVRSNYMMLPLDVKFSSMRLNNYRPYVLTGVYAAFDMGRKKGEPLLLKGLDYGVEVGIGCDIYLPFFKLCPELKFCFGLADVLEKDRPDLIDDADRIMTQALSKATSRMVVLTFNFE